MTDLNMQQLQDLAQQTLDASQKTSDGDLLEYMRIKAQFNEAANPQVVLNLTLSIFKLYEAVHILKKEIDYLKYIKGNITE